MQKIKNNLSYPFAAIVRLVRKIAAASAKETNRKFS
jgi:hypothetical protein